MELVSLRNGLVFFMIMIETNIRCANAMLRLPCKMSVNFSTQVHNFMFLGAVLESIDYLELHECQSACLANKYCKSINYQRIGTNTCQLNAHKLDFDSGEYITSLYPLLLRYGWTYMASEEKNSHGQTCNFLNPCSSGHECIDTCECPGYKCIGDIDATVNAWSDCDEIRSAGFNDSGVYIIKGDLFPQRQLRVFCSMDTDDHGWIVIQRRVDDTVDFNRGWEDYKRGFGDISGNYWIGLDNMNIFTGQGQSAVLRIDLKLSETTSMEYFAIYNNFTVADERANYPLRVSDYDRRSTLEDHLASTNDMEQNWKMFTTKDKDNDDNPDSNCGEMFQSGWWFSSCRKVNLNGLYVKTKKASCSNFFYNAAARDIFYFGISNCENRVMFSEMKIRLKRNEK